MGQRMKKTEAKSIAVILFLFVLIENIISVFLDYCADSGYAVAMAHRLLQGDGMFVKMWEPHQTSAFVIAGFMKLYESVLGTNEGIVIYLHVVGLALYAITATFLIVTLKKHVDKNLAYFMGALLMILRPKMVQLPDYANLTIIFSVCYFIFLIRFFLGNKKPINLIFASVFLCLNVLAYPSCIILFAGLIACILLYSEKKVRDIAISAGVCALFGAIYSGFFILKYDLNYLIQRVSKIIGADTHSDESIYTGFAYYEEFVLGIVVLALCFLFAGITMLAIKKLRKDKRADFGLILSIYFTVFICAERVLVPIVFKNSNLGSWCVDKIILFAIIIIGAFGYKSLNSGQKKIYVAGMITSGCTFVATMLLTNLSFLTIFAYTHLAVMVSFMSMSCLKKEKSGEHYKERIPSYVALACLIILAFSQLLNCGGKAENYVRTGPLKGLVTTLNECNKSRSTYESWNRLLDENDVVLIAQEYGLDPLYYTFSEAGIASFSTISTISLGEGLKEYWDEFPEKEPTVIAVPSWEGREEGYIPDWLSSKMQEEYELSNIEEFWNFYRKK